MFQGSLVAMVTPMMDDGRVDEQALSALVEFHVHNGTNAIVSMGTTGESATLNLDEHCGVIAKTVELVAGRIPVIAGTGANSTSEAIELTRCSEQIGADAALLVTPYYNKPTQEGLYQHHKAVAEAVNIPQLLYNVPGRTGVDMLPETVQRISAIENVIGVKEATGDLSRITRIQELCGSGFGVYSGDDATACEAILLGALGDISVTANVAPAAMSAMCAAALRGEAEQARELDAPLRGLHSQLFVESNPIPVKWALAEMKLMASGIRLPLTPLSSQYHDDVRVALRQANIDV